MKNEDPIIKKARSLSSNITGKGKLAMLVRMISQALQLVNCKYCATRLTLDTMSLDHIVPFGGKKERNNILIRQELDRESNLQIICKKCNNMKGDISHENFLIFNEFLNKHPILAHQLRAKLSQGSMIWNHRRKKNTA